MPIADVAFYLLVLWIALRLMDDGEGGGRRRLRLPV
jgi:hypothetical protein